MKRILTIALLFLYIAVTSGLVMEMHYCMGKWINGSVSMAGHHGEEHTCGNCGMIVANDSKCCHNETSLVKVSDNHQPVTYHFEKEPVIVSIPEFFAPQQNWTSYNNNRVFISYSPPDIHHQVSLQTLYGVYRI